MTRTEKRKFVNELVGNIRKDILRKLPLLPDEWDGHELRRYIADKFCDSAMTIGTKDPHYRARTRAYKNAVIVGNL